MLIAARTKRLNEKTRASERARLLVRSMLQ
jgi:hypothetical protein